MTVGQILALLGMLLSNMMLESTIIPRINIFGLRPDSIIPLIVSMSLVSGAAKGSMYGLAIGLVLDIYFSQYLGMFAAAYVFWGLFIGLFFDKYYAHNAFFPAIAGFLGYLFKEAAMAVQMTLLGESYTLGVAFWRYMFPSALITGLLCIPVYYIYKRNRRFEMRRARWGTEAGKTRERFLR